MKDQYDEPNFTDVIPGRIEDDKNRVEAEIRALCFEQPFAVLATQGEGQPYTNLISFAISKELGHLVFSTPAQSRKFDLISKNKKASLLIDNRSRQPKSINLISAVTITGTARALEDAQESERWSGLLIKRHNYLEKFIKSPSSTLILVDIFRFFYVRRFQEVYQWSPETRS